MTTKTTDSKLARQYVAGIDGIERVRVMRSGEVHAYGRMPNSAKTGWFSERMHSLPTPALSQQRRKCTTLLWRW